MAVSSADVTMARQLYDPGNSHVLVASGKPVAIQFAITPGALAPAISYPVADRHRIIAQLRLALSEFYVHLERKKAIYGYDPIRALDLLAPTVETISDGEFHQSVVQLIARTRDRHLVFTGKAPYGLSAVVPFNIERCWQGDQVQYVVSKIADGASVMHLKAGAIATHWNGIPIERYVRLNANLFDGGNEAASMARSLAFLTVRPLGRFGPPAEEWVDLRFSIEGTDYEERFRWEGLDATQAPVTPAFGRNLTGFGGDIELLHLQHARRVQFARSSFDAARPEGPAALGGSPQIVGRDPGGNFDYGSVSTDHGTYAYIRLWSFSANEADEIATNLLAVLPQLPRNGLIIDIRGNSGGYISAGERLLQLFTPERIVPTRFQFRVTPGTRAMLAATDQFDPWRTSLEEVFKTGEPYSQGLPIEGTDDDVNKIGQRYFGPVVLISDALAFSTADMFAAGFLDNSVGRLICTDENMAAAGGNNWGAWEIVRLFNPDFRLDPGLKAALDAGQLSSDIFTAFNREGASLSSLATLSQLEPEYGGPRWRITDGAAAHTIRHLTWLKDPLVVYLQRSRIGLEDLPAGVRIGVTVRRCVRSRKSEGRLLEDLGIKPDILYRMTPNDIMGKNEDLLTRAALELSQMPSYDLETSVVATGDGWTLTCRSRNLTYLEVTDFKKSLGASAATDDAPVEFALHTATVVEVKGFSGDQLVVRTSVMPPELVA